MTDSNKSKRPPRRKDASREPPTIDLKATVVDEAADRERAGETVSETAPTGDSERAEADRAEGAATETAGPPSPETESTSSAGLSSPETEVPASAPPGGAADEPVPPPRREERRSLGFGSLLGAGLLGGLVGAGGVAAFQAWQTPSTAADPRVAQLQEQVAGLSARPDLQPLEGRIAALDNAQRDLNQRVQAAQQLAEQSAARAAEASNRPVPEAASSEISGNTQAVAELQNRLGSLERQLQERAQASAQEAEALRQQVAGFQQQLAGSVSGVQQQLTERIAGLQQQVTQSAESLRRQQSEQEQRLADLTSQVAGGGSEATRAGIRAVLADRLSSALSQGAPYAEVLAALRDFNADETRVAALEPYAQQGAPTAAELAQEFEPVGERIIRESRSGDSWGDRFLRMADQVVSIRPVDAPGSSDAPSLVARIEAALEGGRLDDAVSAWEALPEPARRLSDDWGQRLKQRAAAEASARAIAADAVSALNSATR